MEGCLPFGEAAQFCAGSGRSATIETIPKFNGGIEDLQVLWQDAERALCRGRPADTSGEAATVLVEILTADHPSPAALDRVGHEYGLKDALEAGWAVRPFSPKGARLRKFKEWRPRNTWTN